jgi:hypothetical protein
MQNLNKENFFNEIGKKYPQAFAHFNQWIDEYKKEIGWDELFNQAGLPDDDKPVKFHDLPYDMQNGILARFDLEKFHGKLGCSKIMAHEPQRIENLFRDVQRAIEDRNIKLN